MYIITRSQPACYCYLLGKFCGTSAAMHNSSLWSGAPTMSVGPVPKGHCSGIYGQLKELPLRSMSLISVSIGVLPTSLTKNSCSMTWEDTVLKEGSLNRSLPNLVGWLGYCVLQYSSRAHWDFSWRLSIWVTSDRPQASGKRKATW